jgi:hypothetical protein
MPESFHFLTSTTTRSVTFATLFAVSACGTTPATQDAAMSETAVVDASVTEDVANGANVVVGTFQVQLVAPTGVGPGYTSVVGRVQNAPTPSQIVWEQRATHGDCRLMVPRVPFCATPCGGTAVCVENDRCRPYALGQNVGTVRVTGVRTSTGTTSFDLISVANAYQAPGSVMLPFPAFAEGDAIRVEAMGSTAVTAFALDTRGIAPLTLSSGSYRMQSGMPLALAWTAPQQTGQTVTVHLDISHHGGTRGKIECTTADDGELVIDATLITRLMALGIAGFPTVVVTRTSIGTTRISAGNVELKVSSGLEVPVEIPNLRSCLADADCDGGMCRPDLTCN